MRTLVDTNIFLYARGTAHAYREPCRAVLRSAAAGQVRLEASVEMVQEFAHVLLRRGPDRSAVMVEVHEVRAQCLLHAFDAQILRRALTIAAAHDGLGMRDAVHAATALEVGIAHVISTDTAFDGVEGLVRVDPKASNVPWS